MKLESQPQLSEQCPLVALNRYSLNNWLRFLLIFFLTFVKKNQPCGLLLIAVFKCWSKMSWLEPRQERVASAGLSGWVWRKWVPCLSTGWVKRWTSQSFSAQPAPRSLAPEISLPGTGLSLNDSMFSAPQPPGVRPPRISGGNRGPQARYSPREVLLSPCSSNILEFPHHLKIKRLWKKTKISSQRAWNKMRINRREDFTPFKWQFCQHI